MPKTTKNPGASKSKPANEAMVSLEDARQENENPKSQISRECLLVMSVPNPRKGADNADDNGNICYHAENQNSVVILFVLSEIVQDVEY